MAAAWAVQRATGQGGWADVFWSFGLCAAGAGAALYPVSGAPDARQWLAAGLIALWGVRLGSHIAGRSLSGPEDARYARLRSDWGDAFQLRLFGFLQLQAGAAAVLVLPVLLAAHNREGALGLHDALGAAVLVAAVIGAGIADRQLAAFRADPATTHDQVMDRGLWSWSRHPNYFFEWLGWCAWPVLAIDLSGEHPWGWLSLVGPAYIYWLLTRVSGIPPLEEHMRRSRPEAFARYAERTSVFFPRPPKA
ncbi:DUF1295 domain-containing protein [Brevundimonas alba]|nr:DUF1295 domain-containing protein [Brevundimonas alba]